MASKRVQRQIDRLLDEAEAAMVSRDWTALRQHAKDALVLDPENPDALHFVAAAQRALDASSEVPNVGDTTGAEAPPSASTPVLPASFASGRYEVKRFLGEGGKKKVYLAHDTTLDRDVAFALIKTDGLDDAGRTRIQREGQAMGRLGSHPHIVTVFDLGVSG